MEHNKIKTTLHPRNKHRERYNLQLLATSLPELRPYIKINQYNTESIDFFDPKAVKMLNSALLKHYYGIGNWDIPQDYLCPPVPGRADYIHHIADLLSETNAGVIPTGSKIKCLDVGTGASCIYPIIGAKDYDWSFVGTDTDNLAVQSAKKNIEINLPLSRKIKIRLQSQPHHIFTGIINKNENYAVSICNPPFHSSPEEAQSAAIRKVKNLKHKKVKQPTLNFGGQSNELWCEGGEQQFVRKMIKESKQFAYSCLWFTSLISKEANLRGVYRALKKAEVMDIKTIPMSQGNKTSRIIAWTFLNPEEQKIWTDRQWRKK